MRKIVLMSAMLLMFFLVGCEGSEQEKPDVFEELAHYENPDITVVQYLGPTTDEADLNAFIDWLASEGFEESGETWDFTFYGFVVQRYFESDDMMLGLNILMGEETTILTTLKANKGYTFDSLPDGHPEHGHMFTPSDFTEELFMPTYPLAISQYFPPTGDPELARFHAYKTVADLEDIHDYFKTVLLAENFEIDYEDFVDEDYFYLEASRGDVMIQIVVDAYDGINYLTVEVDESVGS